MLAIETKGLTKYYGRSRGIIDLNLEVPEGQIFGFIGPNGAGKSTTIRTLLGFLQPTRGEARIFGHPVCGLRDAKLPLPPWQVRAEIGYVPAEVSYYDEMKVRELLAYSASFYPRRSRQEIRSRMQELAEIFALNLDERIDSLSHGNKKKVALIQALQHRPRLLILDEPTSGLDPLIQARLFSVLLEENRAGTTIFFSSHVLSEVQRFCHAVAIIREGRLLAVDKVENLLAKQVKRVRILLARSTASPSSPASSIGQASPVSPATDPAEAMKPVLTLAGVSGVEWTNNKSLSFLYRGDVPALLATLNQVAPLVADIQIEEPSLEEVFLSFYNGEVDDKDAGVEPDTSERR
ncbi:MAG: ABC transporter ATP-binding protein [Limnochordales bacterium]|nr:ABC transporter ATP-binding protein [Limnochordales bacterium]